MNNQEQQARRFDRFLNGILPGAELYDWKNKEQCVRQHVGYMLMRTQSMFRWEGLPETIPQLYLELYLQVNGSCCFYEHDGSLYVYVGALGGEPDVYYLPRNYTIANPAQNLSKVLTRDVDCVVMANDSLYVGLMPMFSRYATALTDTELSLKLVNVNSRLTSLLSASDDVTKESARVYLDNLDAGELGIIGENAFLDGIKAQPYGSQGYSNTITNLIELEQYWKASWFNDLGLNANYNMKRESLNSEESQLNNDALLPLVDDMLRCRETFSERVNEMFGTKISVSLASSWEDNMQEIALEHEEMGGDEDDEDEEDADGGDTELVD